MKFLKSLFRKNETPKNGNQISLSDFREEVFKKLVAQAPELVSTKNANDIAIIDVESNDGFQGQCDLTNFYKDLTLFNGELSDAIDKVVDSILIAVRPHRTVEGANLLPLLRTSVYLGNTSEETRKKVSRPFHGEIFEICMADLPTALRGLTDDDLGNLETDKPLSTARTNMLHLLAKHTATTV